MAIITEKMFLDISRLARHKGISEDEVRRRYLSYGGGPLPKIPDEELTAEERAEDLAYAVLQERKTGRFTYDTLPRLYGQAHRALELSPTCLPAYEACFETCQHKAARDRYILKGVEMGEKRFGGDYECEHAGHFWEITETRSFIRLLLAKADLLLERHQRREALQLYERLMKLQPDDVGGARYPLQSLYLEFGAWDNYLDLIDRFEDDPTPHNYYNYALFLYMMEGDTPDATEAMEEAIDFNTHVLPYLRGKKKPDAHAYFHSQNHGPQSESGAILYCRDALYLWHRQQGIQNWLKKFEAKLER